MAGILDDQLVRGNPGAFTVATLIHRDDIREKLIAEDITGAELWMFFADCCKQDIQTLYAMVEDGTAKAAVMALDWYERGTGKQRR